MTIEKIRVVNPDYSIKFTPMTSCSTCVEEKLRIISHRQTTDFRHTDLCDDCFLSLRRTPSTIHGRNCCYFIMDDILDD